MVAEAGNGREFIKLLEKIGWDEADPLTILNALKEFFAGLFSLNYPTGTMTPYFLNGKEQDFSIQKLTGHNSAQIRHHARFWKTDLKTKEGRVFIGIASLDIKMKWFITHKIDPDLNKEREILFGEFKKTGMIKKSEKIKVSDPIKGKIFNDDEFFSDGQAYLIYL